MTVTSGVGGIIQARMRSQRLPGKVLLPLAGRPLLQYTIDRVAQSRRVDRVVVCTSTEPDDDPIEIFCAERDVACFRGDHENVARRYLDTLDHFGFDAFARICGDSPLIDPALIDRGLEMLASGGYEVVTNNLKRTFPSGQTIEIVTAEAYRRGFGRMHAPEHFEHVTRYFYEHPLDFRLTNFTADEDCSALRTTVDTQEDYDRIAELVYRMDRPHWEYGWRQIVAELHAITA
ncbi:MAG: glycosyltransferase family protein [Phycisphaerae bacterium]|nr:glycosyltransferase family protein [Phycisphaerae bacterium]